LSDFRPAEYDNFGIWIRMLVGETTIPDSEESFDMLLCTPKWLMSNHEWTDIIFGIHYLLVFELIEGSTIENCDDKFTKFLFDSHLAAYEKAGLLNLSVMDKIKILLTPSAEDLFSDMGLAQIKSIGLDQFANYFKKPNFAMQQALELFVNWNEIKSLAQSYYENNKRFFDDMAKQNPQGWSDPQHHIIRIIESFFNPRFRF
jgi:Immunity protein 8